MKDAARIHRHIVMWELALVAMWLVVAVLTIMAR